MQKRPLNTEVWLRLEVGMLLGGLLLVYFKAFRMAWTMLVDLL